MKCSRVATLGIVQRPTFDCSTYPEEIHVDDIVTFNCSFRENITVPLALAWKRGPSQIISSEERVFDGRSHSITQKLHETDNYERFACVFEDEEVCSATPIRIPLTLQIVQTPENVNLYDEVSFSCVPNIDYPPVSEFLWTIIRGNDFEQLNVSSGIYIIHNNGDLYVNSLNDSDIGAFISCSATNAIGMTSNSPSLHISIASRQRSISDITDKHIIIMISGCIILIILLIIIVVLIVLYVKAKQNSNNKVSTQAQASVDQGQSGIELATTDVKTQADGNRHQTHLNNHSGEYVNTVRIPVPLNADLQTNRLQIIGSVPNESTTNSRQSELKYDLPYCDWTVSRWSNSSEDSQGYVRPSRILNNIDAIVEVDEFSDF